MRKATKTSRKKTARTSTNAARAKKAAARATAKTAAKAATAKKPSKNGRGRPPKMIKAFGTEKSLRDWAQDRRCKVTVATLRARLRAGMSPEEAISSPPYQAPGNRNSILVTAFGESKNIRRWSQDKRCKVSYYTLVQRIRTGMDPEMAITAPVTKGFYNKVLFGRKAREKSPNYTPHWVMREARENLPPRPPARRGAGAARRKQQG